MGRKGPDPLATIIRRMGEPSWLILRALSTTPDAVPGFEIIREVGRMLEAADYPYKSMDPSTLHYALKRLQQAGVVRCEGVAEVDVPTGHGSTKREPRPVYRITGVGERALATRDRLAQ